MSAPQEQLIEAYYQQVWPQQAGEAISIEWAKFLPGGPWFAIPTSIRRWTWPWPMLVEFDDG